MKTASWHCHHDKLCEWDMESRETRIAQILREKPEAEHELRLRLYQPMSDTALSIFTAYGEARDSAWTAYDEVCTAASKVRAKAGDCDSAWTAYEEVCAPAAKVYDEVCAKARESLEAIHAIECPNCPWNGTTILPPRRAKLRAIRFS